MPRHILLPAALLCVTATQAQQALSPTPTPDSTRAAYGPLESAQQVRVDRQPLVPVQEQLRQVAGVQATPYAGVPGSPVVLRIRGAASIQNLSGRPLYVVDGMPTFQSVVLGPQLTNSPELLETGNNPLLSIPTQDIESVEVLKGPLATAQYGLYGQDGVVLIRTRQGAEAQPLRVQYQGYGSVGTAMRRYELLDARQYAQLANEAAATGNRPPVYSSGQLAAFGRGTDWQDEVLRPAALGQQQHLAVDGGTARGTRYYAAADYLTQQGLVRNSYLRRYGLRLNLSQTIGQHLRVEGRLGLSQTDERRPPAAVLPLALLAEPTAPARAANGDYSQLFNTVNPFRLVNEAYRSQQQPRILGQLGLYYQVLPGLSVELRGSLHIDSLRLRDYAASVPQINYPGGLQVRQTSSARQWILAPAVRFGRTWQERHTLALAAEAQQWMVRVHDKAELQPASMGTGGSTFWSRSKVRNALLTAGYTYAGRYEVQGLLRADQLWRPNDQTDWQWLPAAQLTWHAGRENFLSGRVDALDVWAGWGRTGTSATRYDVPSSGPVQAGLTAARTTQTEVGGRLALWQRALDITLAAYQRFTEGTSAYYLGSNQLPQYVPYTMRNRGVELALGSRWQLGPVVGQSRLAASVNRNEFDFLSTFNTLNNGASRIIGDGKPIGSFYGARFAGINPGTGQPRYADVNGDGRADFADNEALGTSIPPRLLGFGQSLTWGRLSLQVQVDGMFGYQQYNTVLQQLDQPSGRYNSTTRALDRWTPERPNTDVPRAGSAGRFSDYNLQSGNHLRLTYAQVGVELWQREQRRCQLWLAGHNLLLLTKYRGFDPNRSGAGSDALEAGIDNSYSPTARTVALGLTATL